MSTTLSTNLSFSLRMNSIKTSIKLLGKKITRRIANPHYIKYTIVKELNYLKNLIAYNSYHFWHNIYYGKAAVLS